MKRYLEYIAESKTPQSGYITEKVEPGFFSSIRNNEFEKFKSFINRGVNVNDVDKFGYNALMQAVYYNRKDMVEIILQQPNVDINREDKSNSNFTALGRLLNQIKYGLGRSNISYTYNSIQIEKIKILELLLSYPTINITEENDYLKEFLSRHSYKYFENISCLVNYEFQKKVLDNNREDILLLFNEYNLINPKIKEEYPDLFKAADWGLIS